MSAMSGGVSGLIPVALLLHFLAQRPVSFMNSYGRVGNPNRVGDCPPWLSVGGGGFGLQDLPYRPNVGCRRILLHNSQWCEGVVDW